jgi:tRNA isopentenyl-2-thiomethyl-A-37 hydroxylase MiaE
MGYVGQFVEPSLGPSPWDSPTELYLSLFRAAVADEIPPYFLREYGESFRRHILSPVWVIQCLISNAIKEGEGSCDLGIIADSCTNDELRGQLVEHLEDEARHCRLYVRLIDIVFPESMPAEVLTEIENKLPPLVHRPAQRPPMDDWQLLDNLIQINLGEVRTCIHQCLLEPVLHTYCPEKSRSKLDQALKWLASDESRHIQYTAKRIGQLADADTVAAEALFVARSRDFTAYTERELGSQREGLFEVALR